MTEKTTSEMVADIIGYFLSLDKEDQEIVFKTIKDSMESKKEKKKNEKRQK